MGCPPLRGRAHRVALRCLALGLALGLALPAAAFGPKGHRLIAELAAGQMQPAAREAVAALLEPGESLADASVWMDEMRGSDHAFWSYDYAANWHFANVDPGSDYAASRKSGRGDAVMALQAAIAILEGREIPPGPVRDGLAFYVGNLDSAANRPALRRLALRLLLHLAGDLHQPLHLGYEEDRGGNDIDLRWFGRRSNLHRVWDSQLLDYPGLTLRQYQDRLRGRLRALPEARRRQWLNEPPLAWVEDTLALRTDAYRLDGEDLGRSWAEAQLPLLEEQLLKAGLRLAGLLDRLFAGP